MQNTNLERPEPEVTLPRLRILEILEESVGIHVGAEDVCRTLLASGESVGIATVYRVLTQFEEAGLVIRHDLEGGSAVFEFSASQHHGYLICVRCNRVTEFVDETIERRQRTIADDNGFAMTDHSLIIYGICTDCQRAPV